jgi:hypothetical protein
MFFGATATPAQASRHHLELKKEKISSDEKLVKGFYRAISLKTTVGVGGLTCGC